MGEESEKRLLGASEAAARLHVHPETIRRWIRGGEYFPNAYRLGLTKKSRYVIPESDIIALEKRLRGITDE